jgi:tetratricopeptide (TPR) repeat protein
VPNSFLVNANVATTLVNRSDFEPDEQKRVGELRRGIGLFQKVIAMQNNYVLGYMNLSVAYLKLGVLDSVMFNLNKVRVLYPIHPQLPQMYFYAGQDYYAKKEYAKADTAWHIVLQLMPGFVPAQQGIRAVDSISSVPK